MKISLLVPCYNEETSLRATIESCLKQTRKFDQMVFIDDCSSDKTPQILESYGKLIKHKRTPKNTGNKSGAQEFGMQFVRGDIVVTTDADTLLNETFVEEIEKSFQDPNVAAVAGYVESIPYNWLTLCRAYDYTIGQNIHKFAGYLVDFIFVMPGAASAFRIQTFKKYITFDHDTITEDLDFTYKMHRNKLRIVFNRKAISYTQDPANLKNYINQMRRWFGGGWQNLLKHYVIVPGRPIRALEVSLLYAEGMIYAILIFMIPILNPWLAAWLVACDFLVAFFFGIWAAYKAKRPSLMFAPFPRILMNFVNSYVFLEQFVKEIILKKKNLVWFKPERVEIK